MVKKLQQLRKEQFPKKKKGETVIPKAKKVSDPAKTKGKKRAAKPMNPLKAKRAAKRAKMTDEELAEDEDLRYFEKILGIRKGKALPKDFVEDGFGDLLESLRSDSEYESGESEDENDASVKNDLDAEIEPEQEDADADDDDDDDEEEEEEENERMNDNEEDDDDDDIDSDDAYCSGDEERIAAKQAEIKKRKEEETKKGKKGKGLSEPVVIEHKGQDDIMDEEEEEEDEEEEEEDDDEDDPMNDEINSDDAYCSGDEERISAKQAEIKKRKEEETKKGKKGKGLSEPVVVEHKKVAAPITTTNDGDEKESTSILDSAEGRALLKIVKSQINKLADTNIEPIFNKIMGLESEYTIVQITEALVDCIISSSLLSGPRGTTNIVIQCALCGLLNSTIGSEFGGLLIERITRRFIKATSGEKKEEDIALTLVVLYSHLYNFHVVGCTLIYDVIKNLIKSFTALDIEMLLTLLKQAGPQLRHDDPTSLRDIVLSVQERSSEALSGKDDTDEYGSRVQYMLDTIYELKNNSQKELPELILADRIRKTLQRILEKRGTTLGNNEIRISWAEIATPGQKGRWWIVGSAFGEANIDPTKAGVSVNNSAEEDALAALARKHRMTTGARKAIFGIMLSSDDFIDAFQRIMKLGLKGPQERDIVLVLMYCCSKEKKFNPYYMHLALKLCNYAHNMKFTFQTAFWDQFKNINTMKPREAANIAMLMAHLVGNNAITLAVLKPVEFESLNAYGILFFRIFFETLLTEFDEGTVITVFKKLAVRQDDISVIRVKEGISLFYLQGLGSSEKAETPEEEKKRKLLRQRMRLTKKILLDSVSSDMF